MTWRSLDSHSEGFLGCGLGLHEAALILASEPRLCLEALSAILWSQTRAEPRGFCSRSPDTVGL